MRLILATLLMMAAPIALAQESAIELLRHDIKAEKVAIMTESLPMTEKQGEAFWPLYRAYDLELAKLGDRRIAVIKKIVDTHKNMDDKTAQELVKESFKIVQERTSLLKKTYDKVAKALGPVTAVRFLQIENQLLTLVDAEVIDQVPLVKTKKVEETKK